MLYSISINCHSYRDRHNMKNQYFGDIRDLFKYDLITEIMHGINSLKCFMFIPMLTKPDGKNDGNRRDFEKAKAGTNNLCLKKFLKTYGEDCDRELRDFKKIKQYFKSEQIELKIHKENSTEYFGNRNRKEYFKIEKRFLSGSLIFIDPDNGLQIKNLESNKHLLYSEVKDLYDKMDENSILMIYQHYPRARNKYEEYTPTGRLNKLRGTLKMRCPPLCISDNEIMFFLLANDGILNELVKVVDRYEKSYEKLTIENGDLRQQ